MNKKCQECRGSGVVSVDGKATKTKLPYDKVCPECNGVGHYRV